jgi:putative transcriptional regulator
MREGESTRARYAVPATPSRPYAASMATASSLAPAFLVALDVLVDPNFERTVVLMLEHDPEQGALGLVVNRETDVPLAQLCKTQSMRWLGEPGRRVDWGGPVGEDSGWVLLDDIAAEGVDAIALADGLHWARSRDALKRIAENPALTSRVLLGYAGWGAGQLEAEIAAGAWLVVPARASVVFATPTEERWAAAIRSIGVDPAMLVASQGVN